MISQFPDISYLTSIVNGATLVYFTPAASNILFAARSLSVPLYLSSS